MSTSFQCPYCPRNFSTRNAYSQHVNRCINTIYLSTEESSEDISDIVSSVNEMSLDDEDFSRINEFQIIREENSQVFYQYESDQDYAGDISFGEISHSSNIPEEYENFDEILPANATTTDTLGKSSLHPIYVSLGNIPTWRRNKEDAKQLLGYLPILSAKNEKEKKSSEFKELARETFHNSIKFLLDPLFQGDGVDFNIYDKDIWFFPRISTIICDWPEACTFSLTYKSANSNYPCHFCLVQKEDLIDIRKEVILRNHVNMKEYFDSNTSNLAGLEQVNNYFWSIPNLNIYAATVPDRMHHLDLGLFKYQIEFTMELLKKKKSLNKVNERIANIPRHSQLKVFKKGIQLSRLTASEYRDMIKIMVFVIDDLQIEDLSEVYKAINDWGDLFIKLFQNISNSHLKFPKLHSWIYHIVDTIREYGAINGYTTKTYESLHKTYVKIPYRLSNKKEVEKQIMENTLLITEIRLPNKSPMHLALVQWYDFIEETPFVYGCPLLRLVELYNFIEIEAIEDTIHVVPRFDKNNEYFDQEGGIKHVKTCLLRSLSLKMAVPFPTSLWSRNKREE
ncbi:hypothetical protein Glove_86g99 [Diversispora epigaea]|uniref:C2H2-type domain-containing protein n=1 Tax=Diversispora epigaea TaxID=1348612 RepID=A0A397J6S1_9GLOM|nr:hypothetical protein Glove_86g99 [Diversispora epigaea]